MYKFRYGCKSIMIIDTFDMSVTFGNKVSLVSLDSTIRVILDFKTYLQPLGRLQRTQVPFDSKAMISLVTASRHSGDLTASEYVHGSELSRTLAINVR